MRAGPRHQHLALTLALVGSGRADPRAKGARPCPWTVYRRYIQPMYPIDDVIKMRNLHALFQAVVLKNRNRPNRRQTGAGYLVLVSIPDRLAFFSDHAVVLICLHLIFLCYCLPSALNLIKFLVISISFFIASQLHFNRPIRKKRIFFFWLFFIYIVCPSGCPVPGGGNIRKIIS